MLLITTTKEMRSDLLIHRRAGKRIGLVPTMGALHEGHLSLIELIRPRVDYLVLWLFVNPTQFNSREDFVNYPKRLDDDLELSQKAGVDVVFAPSEQEIYPDGLERYYSKQSVRVYAGDRSKGLEGAYRPGHFDGVVHVVTCFFNIIRPDVAVFGEKDFQQVKVVEQLNSDLHLGVELLIAPLKREESGLALSSRNTLLGDDSATAVAFSGALLEAKRMIEEEDASIEDVVARAKAELRRKSIEPEYVKIVDCNTLEPLTEVIGKAQIVAAANVGAVRLIDTMRIEKSNKRRSA
jgi:pantoate--beta-alanine ligase